ncbi:S1C family serine protease [Clostridium sediminicola]|uniref:PDZ domain-containing protein n=1 Tax=Clostridium sediminicola TaxID=3114879 RepID=UPI0031F223E5
MGIILETLQGVSKAVVTPPYIFMLLVIGIIFYRKNKKITMMQKLIIGEKVNTPLELTLSEIVLGIFGGILCSIILAYLGVGFSENSFIDIIFLLSLLSISFNSKYMKLVYTSAVLGFISILVEIMSGMYNVDIRGFEFLTIDVISLMTMTAVIYFIQGILTMVDGSRGAIPIFSKRNDNIIGGFALKRCWILPLAIIIFTNSNSYSFEELIVINKWRPFLNITNPSILLKEIMLTILPIFGMLTFNTVTFTKTKNEKTLITGTLMMVYSILLFVLSRLGSLNIFFKIAAVLFAPTAIEGMNYLQKYIELKDKPKYVSGEDGIMVLEVAPNSPAYSMGIKSGDKLIKINDKKIIKEDDIFETLKETSNSILLKIKRATGKLEEVRFSKGNDIMGLGLVLVPVTIPKESKMIRSDDFSIDNIIDKIKKKKD